jgi:AcrR family transcriptional regulator
VYLARPKSEERRSAILDALTQTIAVRGVSASTLTVAKMAGVSEGTIFKHFATKDELLNALYRELKLETSDVLMSGFPRRLSVRSRLQHLWNRYVEWGCDNYTKFQALQQLNLWGGLTDEAKATGVQEFENIRQIYRDAMEQHLWRPISERLVGATVTALSEMTVGIIQMDPAGAESYRETCFEMLWSSLSKK